MKSRQSEVEEKGASPQRRPQSYLALLVFNRDEPLALTSLSVPCEAGITVLGADLGEIRLRDLAVVLGHEFRDLVPGPGGSTFAVLRGRVTSDARRLPDL